MQLPLKFVTEPYAHQVAAIVGSGGAKAFAYLMEMRTGKTKVVIDEMAALHRLNFVRAVIVVAPLGVHKDWVDQLNEHGPVDFKCFTHAWAGGNTVREATAIRTAMRGTAGDSRGLLFFTINWDAIITGKGKAAIDAILAQWGTLTMLVADEAHRMKNPKGKRTKAMFRFAERVGFRRVLTGTLVANNPLDIWAPFHFLDPKILNCRTWYAFRSLYAVLKERVIHGRSFQEVVGYQRTDQLKEKIAGHSYSITADECLDLPPRQYNILPVPLSPEQNRMYRELRDDIVTSYDGATMSAPLALTQLLRFQQLLGGFFVPDTPEGVTSVPRPLKTSPRLQVLMDYLEDVQGKVIVWTRFVAERSAIGQALIAAYGADAVAIVNDKMSSESEIKAFRMRPGVRFLVANPEGTAAEGRDFSMATTMVYYSCSFRLTARLQSEARCDKRGRAGTVGVVDMVSRDTVDEHIVESLRNKRDVAATFSGAELRRWLTK